MKMKVKRKEKVKTALEKRNTSILLFIGIAAIPLLLTVLMGFGLGKTDAVNKENLMQALDDAKAQNEQLRNEMRDLSLIFAMADSLVLGYEEKTSKLSKDLRQTNGEKFKVIDEIRQLGNVAAKAKSKLDLDLLPLREKRINSQEGSHIRNFGIKWIEHFISAKEEEFFVRKLNREMDIGTEVNAEFEDKIDQLKEELSECKLDLRFSTMNKVPAGNTNGNELDDIQGEMIALQNRLSLLQGKGKEISGKVISRVDTIKELLIGLTGQRFLVLKNNSAEVSKLKNKITRELDKIERQVGRLD